MSLCPAPTRTSVRERHRVIIADMNFHASGEAAVPHTGCGAGALILTATTSALAHSTPC